MEGHICQSAGGAQSLPTLRHKLPMLTANAMVLRYGNGFGHYWSGLVGKFLVKAAQQGINPTCEIGIIHPPRLGLLKVMRPVRHEVAL